MRAASIAGYVKKRRVRTTVLEPADQTVPDLIKRDFTALAPNHQRYVGNITYLPLAGGSNLYRATVIDRDRDRDRDRGSLAGAISDSHHGTRPRTTPALQDPSASPSPRAPPDPRPTTRSRSRSTRP